MKNYTVFIALLLSACGGPALPVREFLQDKQNSEKFDELEIKFQKEHGCDKLNKLYNFTQQEKPTIEDLSKIMPIFGLKADDAKNIDKVYNIDLSTINKYNCDDVGNADQLINELVQYCDTKYHDTPDKKSDCEHYLKQSIFTTNDFGRINYSYDKRQAIQDKKDLLETGIIDNLLKIYPLPDNTEAFLPEFDASELIKADNTILGTYDDHCSGVLCEYGSDTHSVTKLNAVRVLREFCNYKNWLKENECICFAHETYQKVNYKNVIYIYEKKELPQSKKTEFNQIYEKCEQKIEKQRIKAEKERYGEAKSANSDENNVFIEALENAAWAHRTITETRKKAENKQ